MGSTLKKCIQCIPHLPTLIKKWQRIRHLKYYGPKKHRITITLLPCDCKIASDVPYTNGFAMKKRLISIYHTLKLMPNRLQNCPSKFAAPNSTQHVFFAHNFFISRNFIAIRPPIDCLAETYKIHYSLKKRPRFAHINNLSP